MKLLKITLRIATAFTVLTAVFFLLFSCNSLEIDNHLISHQEQHNNQKPQTECHQSNFFSITRDNILFGLFVLLLAVFLFRSSQKDFSKVHQLSDNFFLEALSPPRLHSFYTQLFSKGLLHSKLF